jgi:hypothetical protein
VGEAVNQVSFELPSLPGSLNSLYEFNRPGSGLPVRRLRAEWALWKSQFKVYVPRCDWAQGKFLRVELDFRSPNWRYKNGKLRRKDIENLEKLAIDTIFEKLGCDDCYIIEKVSKKSVGPSDRVLVRIEEFSKEGFSND